MTSPLTADKEDMELCDTWTCPGCAALVVLPTPCAVPVTAAARMRLDQLAQASCGCWVETISKRSMARLLEAIVGADEAFAAPPRMAAGRRA